MVLDRAYSSTALKYGFPVDKSSGVDTFEFPVAKARLRVLPYSLLPATALVCGYGWSLQSTIVSSFFIL